MRAVAYCRVSTDSEDQLNSLETQKKFFEEYISRSGDTLVGIYADEGVSGTRTKKRVEFQRLMRDAESGLFDILLVKDISRLARNTVDFLQCIRRLKALNIETYFLTANQTILGNSEFALTIFSALAQEESANTSKRVKFGKRQNAERGRVPNLVYGYDKIPKDYFNLLINEDEARIVNRIFYMYTVERFGTSKIAKILNQEGHVTKRGYSWSQMAVTKVLKNSIYIGRVINGKQEVSDFLTGARVTRDEEDWYICENPDLRIVDDKTFNHAQALFAEREDAFHKKKERHSDRHLFSTLIKCACCGTTFRRMNRGSKVKWVCNKRNAYGTDSCENAYVMEEGKLIQAIRDYFINILKEKDDVIQNIIEEFQKIHEETVHNGPSKKELTAQLNKLNKQRQRYMDMYTDDLISREEMREKLRDINKDIEVCTRKLQLCESECAQMESLELTLRKTFEDFENIISMEHMTNAQLRSIIEKIEIDQNGKIDVYLRLLSSLTLPETVLVAPTHT